VDLCGDGAAALLDDNAGGKRRQLLGGKDAEGVGFKYSPATSACVFSTVRFENPWPISH
jgi:hypothetical protein